MLKDKIIIIVVSIAVILTGFYFVYAAPQNSGNIFRNITPEADDTYYNGTTTKRWKEGWFTELNASSTIFSNLTVTDLNATTTNIGDLKVYNEIRTPLIHASTTDFDTLTVSGNSILNSLTAISVNATTTNADNLVVYTDFKIDYMTPGSILYTGANKGITQNNSDLYYDYTNNRVGIGTNSPDEKLEVVGTSTLNLIDASNYRIKNVADPVDSKDAINKAYFDAAYTGGIDWQDSVINILDFTTSEPTGQSVGDRYITTATGTMSVTSQFGYSQHIYTWATTEWATTTPVDRMGLKNVADSNLYIFNAEDWQWNSIGSAWSHASLVDVKGDPDEYHVSDNQYANMFVKGIDDTTDIDEGDKLFYTNARVDTRVQGQDYTITGTWTFNNAVSGDDATSDLHLINRQTMYNYLQGFTWKQPIIDKDLSTPPGAPTLGDRYIVAGGQTDWYDTDWSARQLLDLANADVSAVQTDYPVLIKLTDSGNKIFSTAQTDGDDILFTDEDGNKLKHELEAYNATDELLAWVKVPYLSSTSTTNIYVYYGNAGSGSQQEVADTWDSDYEIVYHMEESSGSADDSTGVYDGSNTSVTYSATGKVGKAYDYNGTNAYTDTNCTTDLSGTGDFTIEGWFEADTGGEVYGIAQAHTAPSYSSDFIFYYNSGTTLWWLRGKLVAEPGGFTATDWNHVVMVWDSGAETFEGFVNGVSAGTSAVVIGYGGINSIKLATRGDAGTSFWDGIMDEVRISTSLRSDDYILTTYNITNDPANFVSFGAEETITASGAWAGHIDAIMEWDSVNWNHATPTAGWAVIVNDESLQYTYDSNNWIISSGALGAHNDTTGKEGGDGTHFYHWGQDDYTEVTDWLDDVVLSDGGSVNLGSGDLTTTGDIQGADVDATAAVTGAQIIANGMGSWPSGPMVGLYVLSGTTGRILPYNSGAYLDLAIGDWNSGDPNIMLKVGGKVGINEGAPETKLHVNGDGYFKGAANTEQLIVRGHTTQTDYTLVVEKSDGTDVFTVNNDGKATTASNINVGGYASSTSGLYTQGSAHIGGNMTVDGAVTGAGKGNFNVVVSDQYRNSVETQSTTWSAGNNQWESSAGYSFPSASTTDTMSIGGDANIAGKIKTTNTTGIEQQSLQSFWAFKYNDTLAGGAVANSGMYFDAIGGSLDIKYLNTKIWSLSNFVTGAMEFGNTLDVAMTFAPNSPQNTGVFTWMEDEDWFATADEWRFTDDVFISTLNATSTLMDSATTTDTLYAGGNIGTAGLMKTSNSVGIEQQTLQSFWPFKYEDSLGAGANTGMYFNVLGGYSEIRVSDVSIWKVSVAGTGAILGNGVYDNIGLIFNADSADGTLTWRGDRDYFKFADDVFFDLNATTTGNHYVGGYATTTGGLFTQGNGRFGGDLTIGGKVGIGTTTPQHLLSVSNGNATTTVQFGDSGYTFGTCMEVVSEGGVALKIWWEDDATQIIETGTCP